MVPALDSQSGLFARLTPCLRDVSGVKKPILTPVSRPRKATVMTQKPNMTQKTNTIRKDA